MLSSTIQGELARVSTLSVLRRCLSNPECHCWSGSPITLARNSPFSLELCPTGFCAFLAAERHSLLCAPSPSTARMARLDRGAFIAHVGAELGVGMPVPQLFVAFLTNCLVALLNAYCLRRLLDPPSLGTFKRMGFYVLITAGISPAIAALGGAFVPILGGGSVRGSWLFWSLWYLANALPSVTLGPVLLIWLAEPARRAGFTAYVQIVEPVAVGIGLVTICLLSAELAGRPAFTYFSRHLLLPLPLIVFASIRYGEKGASGTNSCHRDDRSFGLHCEDAGCLPDKIRRWASWHCSSSSPVFRYRFCCWAPWWRSCKAPVAPHEPSPLR